MRTRGQRAGRRVSKRAVRVVARARRGTGRLSGHEARGRGRRAHGRNAAVVVMMMLLLLKMLKRLWQVLIRAQLKCGVVLQVRLRWISAASGQM